MHRFKRAKFIDIKIKELTSRSSFHFGTYDAFVLLKFFPSASRLAVSQKTLPNASKNLC